MRATLLLCWAIALVAVAMTAPPAGAAVLAKSARGFQGGPALAGDGRVVVGERRGNGAYRVLAIDPVTRVSSQLRTFPALPDPATFPRLRILGDGGVTTAVLDVLRQTSGDGAQQPQPTPVTSTAWTLLPSAAELASCEAPPWSFPQLLAVGGAGFVATAGQDCAAQAAGIAVTTSTHSYSITAATGPFDSRFAPQIQALRATGPLLAWIERHIVADGGPVISTLVVAYGSTGQVLMRKNLDSGSYSIALRADGAVALSTPLRLCSIDVASRSSASNAAIALPPGFCANPAGAAPSFNGDHIVYSTPTGLAATDLQGHAHALTYAGRALSSPAAFDGRTVYAVRRGCDADRLVAVDALAQSSVAAVPDSSCAVRRQGSTNLRLASDLKAPVRLYCAHGCRGTLRLVQQRGMRERTVGEAFFGATAGSPVVRVPVASYARALAGCAGGLRVLARVFSATQDHIDAGVGMGHALSAYRISSRTRCRHHGGPAFTSRRAGPRP